MPTPNVFDPAAKISGQIPSQPRDWYSYPVNFTSVLNAVPQAQNINIQASSDFYLTAITYLATLSDDSAPPEESTRTIPLVRILLTDSGSGRQLMNAAVDLDAIGGTGQWPHRLLMPRFFARNSNIQVLITSFDANATYGTLDINFEGFVIYQ